MIVAKVREREREREIEGRTILDHLLLFFLRGRDALTETFSLSISSEKFPLSTRLSILRPPQAQTYLYGVVRNERVNLCNLCQV